MGDVGKHDVKRWESQLFVVPGCFHSDTRVAFASRNQSLLWGGLSQKVSLSKVVFNCFSHGAYTTEITNNILSS